ncbi:MAG: 4-hydroxythreonine-4-phosphate dehydrogenase PdxA [Gammaproteobacteria bacterium]|nr:4-hydroxythreonine-4-phosphate dehydrogenase PdxA [Gammaproteobacteria bacterium]
MPIAITMGDASGVGPEILLRSFSAKTLPERCVVYGDPSILRIGAQKLALKIEPRVIERITDAEPGQLNVIDCDSLTAADFTPGQLNVKAGRAAYEYVTQATQAAIDDRVAAVVTLPMNKEATQRSVPNFTGHTELLAELCGVDDVVMMLATDEVAVSHVSTHVSLKQAITKLTPERLERTIELTHMALNRFMRNPRIGVCGLNPHAGESGLFGSEESKLIEPVISTLAQRSLAISGPFPADTVFRQAIELDRFDALICMYHDQGHAPMKLYAFDRAVNVTLGLPIIRTSVDHGTAFDIAWQGQARIESLNHAIRYAEKMLNAVRP